MMVAWPWLISGLIVTGLVVYHGFNLLMIVVAAMEIRRQQPYGTRRVRIAAHQGAALPGIAVLVPAYNESVSIVRTVSSILRAPYPDLQVIVVSDGSTDHTLGALTEAFDLRPANDRPVGALATQQIRAVFASGRDPRLLVVDKRNGGKADALNVGLNMATARLVLATDADVILEAHALLHLALPFVKHRETVATSGLIRLHNGCTMARGRMARVGMPATLLESCQVVEYLRAYGLGRLFFNRIGGHLIVSGAFGLFDRQLLLDLGGYQAHAVGEDMELVARIHRHCVETGRPYRLEYSPHAICYTEAPHTVSDLGKQRTRWHHGLFTTLRIHRRMGFNPRFGSVGLVTFPYFLLELYAPVLEAVGWLVLPLLWLAGLLPASSLALFVAVSMLMSVTVSLAALWLDAATSAHFRRPADRLRQAACAFVEPFWYRPLTVCYRLRAFYRYYRTIHLKTAWTSPVRAAQPGR